jgi:hypothetical protein
MGRLRLRMREKKNEVGGWRLEGEERAGERAGEKAGGKWEG